MGAPPGHGADGHRGLRSIAEAQKARHLQRGDRYFGRKQYPEAVIEYRNVLKIEASHLHALQQLGSAHYELGEVGQAFPYLLKSRSSPRKPRRPPQARGDLSPGGRPKDAREEAAYVLDRDPKRLEALLLVAWAARTPEEVGAALRRLQAARADFEDRAKFQLALGSLYLRKQDLAATEAALMEAVTREPKSVDAHLALGSSTSASGTSPRRSESSKAAADLVPVGSPAASGLRIFYVAAGKPDEASESSRRSWRRPPRIFRPGVGSPRSRSPKGNTTRARRPSRQSSRRIRPIPTACCSGAGASGSAPALRGDRDFQKVLKLDSRAAPAHYQLALAQLQAGSLHQAKSELRRRSRSRPTSSRPRSRLES